MPELLLWRGLAIAWATQIFVLSMPSFAGASSRSLLARVLALLGIELAPDVFNLLHVTLRKASHLGVYAVLGYLLYRSFANPLVHRWQMKAAVKAFIVAALYSGTDEIHQYFVPDRGASLVDCLIDCSGAALGLLLLFRAIQWSNRTAENGYASVRELVPIEESTQESDNSLNLR